LSPAPGPPRVPVTLPGGPYAAEPNCDEAELETSNIAPHFAAPHVSTSVSFCKRVIVVPDAGDPAPAPLVNAAGVALLASENALDPDAAELVTAPAGSPTVPVVVPTFTFRTPQGHTLILRRWGVSVLNNVDAAANVVVSITGGPNSGSHPPKPALSGTSADLQEPTLIVLPDNNSLLVKVANRDLASPLLLEFTWTGWLIPASYKGTLRSLTREGNLGWGICK
jgi:hypothetical protein